MSELRHLPRWYRARAERLTAALCELVLETAGHRGLLARAQSAPWGRALGAAVGLGRDPDLALVADLCAAALRPEGDRLDLLLDAGGLRLPDGTRTAWFAVDGQRVRALRPAPAETGDPARRLGAARLLSHGRDSAGVALAKGPPGRAPREVFALCLLADVVAQDAPAPATLATALGDLDGLGVPLAVYDGVLTTLEGWLHRAPAPAFRAAPLLLLRDERLRLEADASPWSEDRLHERDLRFATDLLLRGREDEGPPPPRRPQRRVRRPRGYAPPAGPARVQRNLELFAP